MHPWKSAHMHLYVCMYPCIHVSVLQASLLCRIPPITFSTGGLILHFTSLHSTRQCHSIHLACIPQSSSAHTSAGGMWSRACILVRSEHSASNSPHKPKRRGKTSVNRTSRAGQSQLFWCTIQSLFYVEEELTEQKLCLDLGPLVSMTPWETSGPNTCMALRLTCRLNLHRCQGYCFQGVSSILQVRHRTNRHNSQKEKTGGYPKSDRKYIHEHSGFSGFIALSPSGRKPSGSMQKIH